MTNSILQKLEDERIFSTEVCKDGTIELMEMCDQYFKLRLSKQEVLQLAQELIALTKP